MSSYECQPITLSKLIRGEGREESIAIVQTDTPDNVLYDTIFYAFVSESPASYVCIVIKSYPISP